jgi:hypothetical protein
VECTNKHVTTYTPLIKILNNRGPWVKPCGYIRTQQRGRKLPRQDNNRISRRQKPLTDMPGLSLSFVSSGTPFVINYIRYKSSLCTCPDHGTNPSPLYHDTYAYICVTEIQSVHLPRSWHNITTRAPISALPLRRTVRWRKYNPYTRIFLVRCIFFTKYEKTPYLKVMCVRVYDPGWPPKQLTKFP